MALSACGCKLYLHFVPWSSFRVICDVYRTKYSYILIICGYNAGRNVIFAWGYIWFFFKVKMGGAPRRAQFHFKEIGCNCQLLAVIERFLYTRHKPHKISLFGAFGEVRKATVSFTWPALTVWLLMLICSNGD